MGENLERNTTQMLLNNHVGLFLGFVCLLFVVVVCWGFLFFWFNFCLFFFLSCFLFFFSFFVGRGYPSLETSNSCLPACTPSMKVVATV